MKIDFNNLIILLNSVVGLITVIFVWYLRQEAAETKALVLKTEINTNSLTEKLTAAKDVAAAATDRASHAAGKEEGRLEGEAKAATLAEGKWIAGTNVAKVMAMPEANGNGKPATVVLHDDAKTTKAVVKTKRPEKGRTKK